VVALVFCASTGVEHWAGRLMQKRDAEQMAVGFVQVEPPRQAWSRTRVCCYSNYPALRLEQRTQAGLLESRALLQKVLAMRGLQIRNTSWFKSFHDPADAQRWLQKHFHADAIPDSKLIKVWLDPIDSKQEARTIVMDIVNTHADQQRRARYTDEEDRIYALTKLNTRYETRARELSNRLNALILRLRLPDSKIDQLAGDMEFTNANVVRSAACVAAIAARAEYEHMAASIQDGGKLIQDEEPDRLLLTMREQIASADAEIRSMAHNGAVAKAIRAKQLRRDEIDEQLRFIQHTRAIQARNLQLSIAQDAMQSAESFAKAADQHVEQFRPSGGDKEIATFELLLTREELKHVGTSQRHLMKELDTLGSSVRHAPLEWVLLPLASD
jgi:hypothetical protein